jgi:hypothetical protein
MRETAGGMSRKNGNSIGKAPIERNIGGGKRHRNDKGKPQSESDIGGGKKKNRNDRGKPQSESARGGRRNMIVAVMPRPAT